MATPGEFDAVVKESPRSVAAIGLSVSGCAKTDSQNMRAPYGPPDVFLTPLSAGREPTSIPGQVDEDDDGAEPASGDGDEVEADRPDQYDDGGGDGSVPTRPPQ